MEDGYWEERFRVAQGGMPKDPMSLAALHGLEDRKRPAPPPQPAPDYRVFPEPQPISASGDPGMAAAGKLLVIGGAIVFYAISSYPQQAAYVGTLAVSIAAIAAGAGLAYWRLKNRFDHSGKKITAVAVALSIGAFLFIDTPEQKSQRELEQWRMNREKERAEYQKQREAEEAAALKADPLRDVKKRKVEEAFKRPFSVMFGKQVKGTLCAAFSNPAMSCRETGGTTADIQSTVASLSGGVQLKARNGDPLLLETTKFSSGRTENKISIEGSGPGLRVRNYDHDLRTVAANILGRYGINMSLLDRCEKEWVELRPDRDGRSVSCNAGHSPGYRYSITVIVNALESSP